jgi:Kdo2-lipid IVA lauroyltransferase/acyltransferase
MLYNLPVVFAATRKIRRGCYKVHFELLVEDPSVTAKGEITRLYMEALGKVIIEKPEYYLWSHRRWKLKNPNREN